ncbi:BQ5605_C005g03442 [Microbotryum silenes-dioicae]|uniref:BQ5605_C005g03442 protein n=1 Tax=Microbotryum silenes-dioicae TaxID=796604 RepID=A0A2X0MAV4_9BASI|nr:BQ5605_C005g03442 [Microbotryum silenes-dioicae]
MTGTSFPCRKQAFQAASIPLAGPHRPVAFSCLSGASSHPVGQIKPSLHSSSLRAA